MSLGQENNNRNNFNNNEKRNYPTVYSNYKISNPEAQEPSQLSFAFSFNGLLKFIIAPKKETNNSQDFSTYDHENEAFAFISFSKAKILVEEIKRLKKGEINNTAVPTKHGLISIVFDDTTYILSIQDIDPDTGLIISSYSYEMKTNTSAINNYNKETGEFTTYEYNNIELDFIQDLLEQYYLSSSNAIAYSVINANRYNDERNKNSLEAIKKQLNIPTAGQYSNKNSGGQYFSKPQTPSQQQNYDDLESRINDLDA